MTGLTDPSVLFRAAQHALAENRPHAAWTIAERTAAVCPSGQTLDRLFFFRAAAGRLDLARAALDDMVRSGAGENVRLFREALLDAWTENITAAIEKLELILRRDPAADVSVKYALGSLLAATRQFREANAIFGRGLLIECGDGKLTCTRIIRFPEEPSPNVEPIPLDRRVDFPSSAADAQDAEAIYFVSADSRYFELFAPSLCKSLATSAQMPIAVHIHVINPAPTLESAAATLRRDCPIPILLSTESTRLDHLEARARRVYYACARFLVLPELLRLYRRVILVADIDQLVIGTLRRLFDEFRGNDFGLLKFPLAVTSIHALISATAVVVAAGPGGAQFCRTLYNNLAERMTDPAAYGWHLDQAALAVAYLMNEDLRTYWISPSLLDASSGLVAPPRNDALFWTVTMTIPANTAKLSSTYFMSASSPQKSSG